MDWSQSLYICILGLSFIAGLPRWQLATVMLFNLSGTMWLRANPEYVATLDLASFVLLIGGSRREVAVATVFLAMAAWEFIASRLQVELGLIYWVTDAMAYVQCGVIGGADRGMGRMGRAFHRHWIGRRRSDTISGRLFVARDAETDLEMHRR